MSQSEPELLTLREVAKLLRVGMKTAYSLVQAGELPGFKVGGQWRFRRADIDAWIDEQMRAAREEQGGDDGEAEG
ncbi:MAG: helix-turn-helix domain-containing protein [Myxococcota bacterium]